MPTLDDLRSVLTDRESFAPDADAVKQRVAAGRASRRLAPLVAAASVVLLAATAVVLTSTHHHESGPPAGHTRVAAPQPGRNLQWSFTLYNRPGYTMTFETYTPQKQTATITGRGARATITVYSPGVVDHAPSGGTSLPLYGGSATYLTRGTTASLWWQYRSGGWVSIEGTLSQSDIVSIAQGLDFGAFDDVRTPLDQSVPAGYLTEAVERWPKACIGYGRGGAYRPGGDLGTVLTVCLVPKGEAGTVGQRGDRVVVQELSNGTTIVVALSRDHLADLSTSDLTWIAKNTHVSGTPADPSSWGGIHG